jgi:protein TonB
MDIGRPVAQPARNPVSAAISVGIHGMVLSALLYHGRHWIAPIRYPGTEDGHHLVLTYLPGRAAMQTLTPAAKIPREKAKLSLPLPEKKPSNERVTSLNIKSPVSDHPDSTSGADALGSGDISIALAKYFPTPQPDLSSMMPGTKGDVVLDIIIDENGKISDLKLIQGIEQKIDETVIATIRQWIFHPANRDGRPVASEQELRFHYEKG